MCWISCWCTSNHSRGNVDNSKFYSESTDKYIDEQWIGVIRWKGLDQGCHNCNTFPNNCVRSTTLLKKENYSGITHCFFRCPCNLLYVRAASLLHIFILSLTMFMKSIYLYTQFMYNLIVIWHGRYECYVYCTVCGGSPTNMIYFVFIGFDNCSQHLSHISRRKFVQK